MPRAASGEGVFVEKAPISAEARRIWPEPMVRDDGGRKEELDASGVLLRLPKILLADILNVLLVIRVVLTG